MTPTKNIIVLNLKFTPFAQIIKSMKNVCKWLFHLYKVSKYEKVVTDIKCKNTYLGNNWEKLSNTHDLINLKKISWRAHFTEMLHGDRFDIMVKL